ncbi:MAG TPA: hypothetical protein VMU01_06920 [Rhizomicrobium sp.]|nr:hypothetical protein [Rhizomicrobium sp.]
MTASRSKWLVCAVAIAALAAPAAAQWSSDKPPVLGPDDYPPVADQDSQAAAAPAGTGSTTTSQSLPPPSGAPANIVPADAASPPPPAVEVDSLGKPEGPPVGTLETASGGLGARLWSGSDRGRVEDLLNRAPLAVADPAMRDLTRRIVLTRADAPPGSAPHAFTTVRLEKLLDAGFIDEAGALASMAQVEHDPEFARVQADALLIADRSADVCGSDTATRDSSGEVFWMQLRAYCSALAGDTATAQLTRDVLAAQGNDDPAYDALIDDVLNHRAVPPGAIAHPTAIHLYLLQQAGLPVPEVLSGQMGTAANLLTLRDARNPARARFEAAERVVMTGAVSPSDLKVIADAQDLPLSKVASASVDAPSLPFFMGQVLLRRAATIEPRPDERARLIDQALALADGQGMLPLAAALQADVIATIKPSPTNGEFARSFARALLLAGRPETAARWAAKDPVLDAVAGLMSSDPARAAAAQQDMSAFAAGFTDPHYTVDPDRQYKALVLGIADVLGLPMPPDAKAEATAVESQIWDGKRPGPGTMRTIEELASQPDRRGEVLLMMLDAMHQQGLRDMAPDVTIDFVRLIASMGEARAARGLAFEALAQYVPPPLPPQPTASTQ